MNDFEPTKSSFSLVTVRKIWRELQQFVAFPVNGKVTTSIVRLFAKYVTPVRKKMREQPKDSRFLR